MLSPKPIEHTAELSGIFGVDLWKEKHDARERSAGRCGLCDEFLHQPTPSKAS
jgi:hypothetical protein